jgi:hypothetical protein
VTDQKTCPLGDDCDLTVAWMAGQAEARDSFRARIEQLETQLGLARIDAQQQRERASNAEAELRELDFLRHEGGPQSVAALEAALKPFADFCAVIDDHSIAKQAHDDREIHPGLTVGDFRRARKALTGEA